MSSKVEVGFGSEVFLCSKEALKTVNKSYHQLLLLWHSSPLEGIIPTPT